MHNLRFTKINIRSSVVDLGFPRGGGANHAGVSTYDFAKFSQKLHEIERIWTPRGDTRPKFYYVDLPLLCVCEKFDCPICEIC